MLSSTTKKISIFSAIAIAAGTCLPASLAFADDPPPSVGDPSGAGSTALTMQWQNPDTEYSGYGEPNTNNPDENGDYLGDNLAFKAPTAINFVAKANGTLQGPSAGSIRIENHSSYGIHVSSMKIDENSSDGWNIVANAEASSGIANAVWGTIGPSGDALNWASYVPSGSENPIAVAKPYAWNMGAKGASNNGDQLSLDVTGNVANLNINLAEAKTFGVIHWYLKAGNATFEIPTTLSGASLSSLTDLSSALRGNSVSPSAVSGLIGQTVSVTLADNTSATARLVDATSDRGLVFQFVHTAPIAEAVMNIEDTNAGGWRDSNLRTNLNSGTIYTTKLQNMRIAGEIVDPVATTLSSLDANYYEGAGHPQVVETTGDKFWVPSITEIYGTGAWAALDAAIGSPNLYTGDEGCSQFAYYASLHPDPTDNMANPLASTSSWKLRSASPNDYNSFMNVSEGGMASRSNADSTHAIAPCFCL